MLSVTERIYLVFKIINHILLSSLLGEHVLKFTSAKICDDYFGVNYKWTEANRKYIMIRVPWAQIACAPIPSPV